MIFKHPELSTTCTFCGACYNICTHNSISFKESDEGFNYPIIDNNICIHCGICDIVCPIINKENKNKCKINHSTYYGWHLNEFIREKSTSGGIFSALAEYVLEYDGVIYGAFYDFKNRIVRHTSSKEIEYTAFRKSKYVQSFIGNTFTDVKKELRKNSKVLFSGTPCQISGLLSFLGKTYDNLITCDFICHGVPPMKLLNTHIDFLESKYKDKMLKFDFRSKAMGWSQMHYEMLFKDNGKILVKSTNEAYHKAFAKKLSIRKSCFECLYSDSSHPSDITIADFGGYGNLNSGLNDEKGLSMIMVNSIKGQNLISDIKSLNIEKIDNRYGEYAYTTHKKDNGELNKRELFFRNINNKGWEKTIKRFHLERDPILLIIKNKTIKFVKIILGPTIVSKLKAIR